MKPLLLIVAALALASCGPNASYHEILTRSKAEVALREDWAEVALIRIEHQPGHGRPTWRVSAGAFDYSDYPEYRGMHLIPGTERVLHFSRDGCLLRYADDGSRCAGYYPEPVPGPPPAGTGAK